MHLENCQEMQISKQAKKKKTAKQKQLRNITRASVGVAV